MSDLPDSEPPDTSVRAAALRVACSCVLDDTPRIWSSFVPWLAAVTGPGAVAASRIHVHHVCELRPGAKRICLELGVRTHRIAPFDPVYPHTNKIQQCFTDFGDSDRIMLTDVDLAWARPPPLEDLRARVACKPVDQPNPPLAILRRVFAAARVRPPRIILNGYRDQHHERRDFQTYAGNCNGGLYVLTREILARLGRKWSHWTRWLITNIHLLDRWSPHVDQVGFCLALADIKEPVGLLEDAWNFPLHLNVVHNGNEPIALHHHTLLEDGVLLKRNSAPGAARPAIDRINEAIRLFRGRFPGVL